MNNQTLEIIPEFQQAIDQGYEDERL